jgi:hypothetical protein
LLFLVWFACGCFLLFLRNRLMLQALGTRRYGLAIFPEREGIR